MPDCLSTPNPPFAVPPMTLAKRAPLKLRQCRSWQDTGRGGGFASRLHCAHLSSSCGTRDTHGVHPRGFQWHLPCGQLRPVPQGVASLPSRGQGHALSEEDRIPALGLHSRVCVPSLQAPSQLGWGQWLLPVSALPVFLEFSGCSVGNPCCS